MNTGNLYGFKDESTAKTLKAIAVFEQQRPDTTDQGGDFGGQPRPSQNVMPVRGLSGGGAMLRTQSVGIAAMVGDTPGMATCDMWGFQDATTIADAAKEVDVYNIFSTAIAGNTYITAKRINGRWVVDAEDCPGELGATNP